MSYDSLPNEIHLRLTNDATVAGLVADRIHYQVIPQSSAYPHVWFNRTGDDGEKTLDGQRGLATEYFAVEVISETSVGPIVDAVAAVINAIEGPVGNGVVQLVEINNMSDDYAFRSADGDALFMHAFEVEIHHDGNC